MSKLFPLRVFKEKKTKFEFIKKLKKIAKKIKVLFDSNIGFKNKKLGDLINNGKEPKKIAMAGAGSPLKSLWLLSFDSRLNLANLLTAASVNIKPHNDNGVNSIFSFKKKLKSITVEELPFKINIWLSITPGKKPLVITSAIESNWTPKSVSESRILAKKPSKKSKKIPNNKKINTIKRHQKYK